MWCEEENWQREILMQKNIKNNIISDDEEKSKEYLNQEKIVNNYISEINVFAEQGEIIFECLWNIVLFVISLIIFVLCIIFSDFSTSHI